MLKTHTARWAGIAVVVTALASTLTGCNSSASDSVSSSSRKPLSIIFVSHSSTSDPFWVIVNNGYQAALDLLGDKGVYRAQTTTTFDAKAQAQQIDQAISSKPDGLIVTDTDSTALDSVIKKATDAGIPTVLVNAGGEATAIKVGALTYVGSDEQQSGALAGQRFKDSGVTKPILITTLPGVSPAVDDRNAGFESAYPGATVLQIPTAQLTNSTAVTKAIEATLAAHPDADGVFSVGSLFNPAMLAARTSIGGRADAMHFASIDLGAQVVTALQAGQMDFALDQQQYLQGFDPVVILDQYVRYGLTPGNSNTVTGPSIVTKEDLGAYAASLKAGVR